METGDVRATQVSPPFEELRVAPPMVGSEGAARPARLALKEDDLKNGLGKLVLTLVELIRQLLERQAIRRMEAGSLTDAEAERLGVALMRLAAQMDEMKQAFGVTDDDLNLDLGPLGRLF